MGMGMWELGRVGMPACQPSCQRGQWSVVSGQRSAVSSQWPVASGQCRWSVGCWTLATGQRAPRRSHSSRSGQDPNVGKCHHTPTHIHFFFSWRRGEKGDEMGEMASSILLEDRARQGLPRLPHLPHPHICHAVRETQASDRRRRGEKAADPIDDDRRKTTMKKIQ